MKKKKLLLAVGIAIGFVASAGDASAKKFMVLHSFGKGHDGSESYAGLVADSSGNVYGTTEYGGHSTGCGGSPCGTVFKIAADGSVSTLYSFRGGLDGAFPESKLFVDKSGNLFGTTTYGGSSGCFNEGCGTVFKITPEGKETVLYAFKGGADGNIPYGGVIADKKGSLYGTTQFGGGSGCAAGIGCGTVFKLTPDGTETILHTFLGGNDGSEPGGSLLADKDGDFFGTTETGGGSGCAGWGCGVVFKITPDKTETVLHKFEDGNDGSFPYAELVADEAGNLYGTTSSGGGNECGCGTVFKTTPSGTTTILHSFQGDSDGGGPKSGLVADKAGNFYGTASYGGAECGCGTVFKLSNEGVETTLHAFGEKGNDGDAPYGNLAAIGKFLYGTTSHGGKQDAGTIFKMKR